MAEDLKDTIKQNAEGTEPAVLVAILAPLQ